MSLDDVAACADVGLDSVVVERSPRKHLSPSRGLGGIRKRGPDCLCPAPCEKPGGKTVVFLPLLVI